KSIGERAQGFTQLFSFVVIVDALAAAGLASKDEVWGQLATVWTGPLDDIFFAIVGVQAGMFLLDPTGRHTLNADGSYAWTGIRALLDPEKKTERVFAKGFVRGSA